MKKIILSICLIILIKLVSGQDIIIKKNGEEIKANITEATSTLIMYQTADNPKGVILNLKKSEIYMIKYKSGQTKIFNDVKKADGSFPEIDSTITKKKRKYYLNGEKLSKSELKAILATNPATFSEMEKFNINRTTGSIINLISYGIIGYGIYAGISSTLEKADNLKNNGIYTKSGNPGIPIMVTGVAFSLFSLPFIIPANKQLKKAVNIYNSKFQKRTSMNSVKLNLVLNPDRVGLRLSF